MTIFSDLHRELNIPPDYHIERDTCPNPKLKTIDLADMADCGVKTIQNYRAALKREGRI